MYKVDQNKRNKYPDWVKGIASFNKKHLTKFDFIVEDDIIEEIVDGDRLDAILEEHKLEYIDFLQINTEGYDYKVLAMFDFQKFHPLMVKLEFVNLSKEEKIKSRNLLLKNGYTLFQHGLDLIGIDINKLAL